MLCTYGVAAQCARDVCLKMNDYACETLERYCNPHCWYMPNQQGYSGAACSLEHYVLHLIFSRSTGGYSVLVERQDCGDIIFCEVRFSESFLPP